MIRLVEYLRNINEDNIIIESICQIEGEEMINESFQSSLLTELAKKIKKYSKKSFTSFYFKDDTFSTLFAPQKSRDGKIRGVMWSRIKDDDFIEYSPNSKDLKKVVKELYTGVKDGYIIVKNGGTIKYAIKCFYKKGGYKENDTMPFFYSFNEDTKKLERETKSYYSSNRNLKMNEALDLLNSSENNEIFILKIDPSMIEEYEALAKDRKDAQTGVINTDKDSLRKLLSEQRARYKELIKEIKAKKALSNKENLFDDLQKLQKEAYQLYEESVNADNYDAYSMLDDVLWSTAESFTTLTKMLKTKKEIAKIDDYKADENVKNYYKERENENYNRFASQLQETIDKVNKKIDKVKEILNK